MEVKNIELVELNEVKELIKRVFEEFEYFDYSQEGINKFYKSIEIEQLIKEINDEYLKLIGTFENEELTGVLGYKKDRITLFYVDYDYQGHGMGKALLQYYLEESKINGYKQIIVNSTLLGEEIFEKYGFFKVGDIINENGADYIPMAYNLVNVALGSIVSVIVDSPIGTMHPYLPDTSFKVNLGFINDILNTNDEFQEAYIYGVYEPIEVFTGTVIGIIHYLDRDVTKWIVSENIIFNKENIINDIGHLEQGIDLKIEWLNIN